MASFYIGMTSDLPRRIVEHKNKPIDCFTSRKCIDQLVYYELTSDVWCAYAREAKLKKWRRAWKIKLIEDFNPEWKDLYYDIGSA